MASTLLAKLLILTILVTISRANEELMMQQCHNSKDTTICLRCLSSNPASPQADQVGIARIILRCVNSHLISLANITSGLTTEHHWTPEGAAALKQCGLGYKMAKRGLGRADAYLIVGDYDKAADDVRATESPLVSCRNSLVTVVFNLSFYFSYHTKVSLALTQSLLRIIDRF
ncbi:unnamed protein product [Microthlaspi erraticum]|uniref:Pectinesterase inhibitor domain-containing protein n=1 Tax=Microthlaspi erraticum TaxID=1685480 RepID=A0A6D2HNP1_9BRAS|nr:unnamed protein product [Microthlaspi erraticum]